jgi:hypothetical protein
MLKGMTILRRKDCPMGIVTDSRPTTGPGRLANERLNFIPREAWANFEAG